MNKVAKVASGTTAAVGLGGTAYGTYDYKTTTVEYSINLTEKSAVFVKENDSAQLRALVKSYRDSAIRNKTDIPGLVFEGDGTEDQKKLFNKCEELKNTSIRFKSDEAYKKLWFPVSYWCMAIKDIEDALSIREGRTILSVMPGMKDDFNNKFDIYKGESEFKTFLGKNDSVSLEKSKDSKVYEDKCKDVLKRKVSDPDYDSNLESARKYCFERLASR